MPGNFCDFHGRWLDVQRNAIEIQRFPGHGIGRCASFGDRQLIQPEIALKCQHGLIRTLLRKMHPPAQIDGAIPYFGIKESIEVGLKGTNLDVLQLKISVGLQWFDRHRSLHTDRSGFIQLQRQVDRERLLERNLHILHDHIHCVDIDLCGLGERSVLI